jgi:hypothetical protein
LGLKPEKIWTFLATLRLGIFALEPLIVILQRKVAKGKLRFFGTIRDTPRILSCPRKMKPETTLPMRVQ